MSVRAKFKVDAKREFMSGSEKIVSIEMSPVYKSGDPNSENSQFFKWTPTGKIEIGCARAEVADKFELGKEYYIDFTPVEPAKS
jgi:hypothetical protein